MNWVDHLFSLMYRRDRFGAVFCSILKRTRLYGLAVMILERVDKTIKIHDDLSRFQIAVCANVSAGKSTLVNALLGKDLLPSRNEATTARITSICDRDGMNKVFGCCISRGGGLRVSTCAAVGSKLIELWNSDPNVTRVFLQTDLNGIGNQSKAVVIHDTPGNNNSQNLTHREMVLGFLKRAKLNALLYVVNFENMLSDDQSVLLRDVIALLKSRKVIPVLFAVNKLDSVDPSKEDARMDIEKFSRYVREVGYTDYLIVPVSAKAGRLLKMAILGRAGEFTENECDDFDLVFKKFLRRMDVRSFGNPSFPDQKSTRTYGTRATKISVAGIEYDVDQLATALTNTGIPVLEETIEKLTQKQI